MPHTPADIALKLANLAEAYNADADLRSRAEADPRAVLVENGFEVPSELDVSIVSDTPEVSHVVFPPNPNSELSDETLALVAGGSSWGTASCPVSTASSTGSIPDPTPIPIRWG